MRRFNLNEEVPLFAIGTTRLHVFIESEDSDAFGMDRLENGMDGGVGLLIEDGEIYFEHQ